MFRIPISSAIVCFILGLRAIDVTAESLVELEARAEGYSAKAMASPSDYAAT